MIRERSRNVLHFIKHSVEEEGESLLQARKFVEKLEQLDELEKLVLGCALESRAQLKAFAASYKD
jgi:hypothetical protein